mmetsp:Transcript_10434/g.22542  ORF Transcript_10434/g.22542 Transcript_10434/m.22542 type:complete len:233 (-) Transcript_10434:189-887(-)
MAESIIITTANTIALLGWSIVLLALLSQSTTLFADHTDIFFRTTPATGRILLIDQLFGLECICILEVLRIALGHLKGNFVLGAVLHAIRLTCIHLVLADGLGGVHDVTSSWNNPRFLSTMVLYSWSITEVGRYPMYLFPESALARRVRMVVPLFTFPVGAAAEALGAYGAIGKLLSRDSSSLGSLDKVLVFLLVLVVAVNSILGPTMAYPALLKKGLPILMGKGERKRTKKE